MGWANRDEQSKPSRKLERDYAIVLSTNEVGPKNFLRRWIYLKNRCTWLVRGAEVRLILNRKPIFRVPVWKLLYLHIVTSKKIPGIRNVPPHKRTQRCFVVFMRFLIRTAA